MNWKKLLTSPPPSAVCLLEPHRLALVCRDKKGQIESRNCDVERETFEVGPVGLQAVDGERLGAELDRALDGWNHPKRAAVITPTGWFRSHLLTFDELPSSKDEMEDIVRWRLKRMLPIRPSELRLSISPAEGGDSQHGILCMVGIERALASLEAVFESKGIQIGQLTGLIFVLADTVQGAQSGVTLVVQHEESFLSFLLLVGGNPRLMRMKPLPVGGLMWPSVERELRLVWSFVQKEADRPAEVKVILSCQDDATEHELRTWWLERDGAQLEQETHAAGGEVWYTALDRVQSAAALAVLGMGTEE
jgi:hypothetical protein